MFQKLLFIILLSFSLTSYSTENSLSQDGGVLIPIDNTPALIEASQNYLDFINKISSGHEFPRMETASLLLTPDCKKNLNGQPFTSNREAFVNDLLFVYATQGPWKIYPIDIITSSSNNAVVLYLFIEMKNLGSYTAIVILRYNPDLLITEINEVLNKTSGSYNFKGKK